MRSSKSSVLHLLLALVIIRAADRIRNKISRCGTLALLSGISQQPVHPLHSPEEDDHTMLERVVARKRFRWGAPPAPCPALIASQLSVPNISSGPSTSDSGALNRPPQRARSTRSARPLPAKPPTIKFIKPAPHVRVLQLKGHSRPRKSTGSRVGSFAPEPSCLRTAFTAEELQHLEFMEGIKERTWSVLSLNPCRGQG